MLGPLVATVVVPICFHGFLVRQPQLQWPHVVVLVWELAITVSAAAMGALCGVNVGYWLFRRRERRGGSMPEESPSPATVPAEALA
ncbi:MAG: hypothetical protein ABIS84_00540 [Arachnia sp.]